MFAGKPITCAQTSTPLDVVDEVIPFSNLAVLTTALQESLALGVEESNVVNIRVHKRKILRGRSIKFQDLKC